MKLATPLTIELHKGRGPRSALVDNTALRIANVYRVETARAIMVAVNDHARLTADLADAVAALKNYARDCTCASCCTTRALVARVEART